MLAFDQMFRQASQVKLEPDQVARNTSGGVTACCPATSLPVLRQISKQISVECRHLTGLLEQGDRGHNRGVGAA